MSSGTVGVTAMRTIFSVVSMCSHNYLTPGVILLTGTPAAQLLHVQAVTAMLSSVVMTGRPSSAAGGATTAADQASAVEWWNSSNVDTTFTKDDSETMAVDDEGDDAAAADELYKPQPLHVRTIEPKASSSSAASSTLLADDSSALNTTLRLAYLQLRRDEDKLAIHGDPRDIRGGLFKLVDDANNPAHVRASPTHQEFVCVFARVNALGQYYVRELVEQGISLTHCLALRKDRVMFVLCIDDDVAISAPIQSRSHSVLHCQ
jgi:hypothetical protein